MWPQGWELSPISFCLIDHSPRYQSDSLQPLPRQNDRAGNARGYFIAASLSGPSYFIQKWQGKTFHRGKTRRLRPGLFVTAQEYRFPRESGRVRDADSGRIQMGLSRRWLRDPATGERLSCVLIATQYRKLIAKWHSSWRQMARITGTISSKINRNIQATFELGEHFPQTGACNGALFGYVLEVQWFL